MQFYTTETLSPNRELTPEGYLLCRATRVARTGTQLYAAAEVPVRAVDGVVRIERDEGEVFRPATLHSFQAKPVTLDHPATDVTPDNWTQLAKGLMLDVRRGAGLDSDFIVADLLLTDAALIRAVTANQIRELSAGYTADYQEIQPGRGRQTNIVGNHLALVDKGRCGARCSIGDRRPMRKTRSKWFDSLRAAFQARDERTFEETLTRDADEEETEEEKKKRLAKEKEDDEEEKKKTSDALGKLAATLKTLDARLAKLETRDADEEDETEEEKKKRLAKEKKEKEEKEEKEGKTGDSAGLADAVQDVFARAEILSPGVSLPTYDAKAPASATRDSLCSLRLKAVKTAFEAGKYRDAITPFLGTAPNFGALTCDQVAGAFIGASEIVRRENNAGGGGGRMTFDGAQASHRVADSIAAINKKNREFWQRT